MSAVCHDVERLDTSPDLCGTFIVHCIKVLIYITPAGMMSLNLIQPRVMWEERVNEGLSQSGWPEPCLLGTVLFMLTNVGRPSPLWASAFSRQRYLNCARVRNQAKLKQVSDHVYIHFSLLLTVHVI